MAAGVVAESDLTGTLKSEYIFFAGTRVARRDLPSGTVSYYFADHLKSASVVTDASGSIKADSDYEPWGGERQFINNDSNRYKFTGKERDIESGLDYFGARYYGSRLGRFLTPDWAGKPMAVPYAEFGDPQSLNLYSYVRNSPIMRVDLDGHDYRSFDSHTSGSGEQPEFNESHGDSGVDADYDSSTDLATGTTTVYRPGSQASGVTQQAINAGNFVVVGERPLLATGATHWNHTYLQIPEVVDGKWTGAYHTYGVLGEMKGDKGTSSNQQVRSGDSRNGSNPNFGSDRNHRYLVPATAAQRAALEKGAIYWTSHQCPSCGGSYVRGGPLSLVHSAFNSNTWVYNMLIHNPAGRIEPPALSPKRDPGWQVNDVGNNYYPK